MRGPFWIPFNKPYLAGRELDYMRDAVERGHISGDGEYTRRASVALAGLTGSPGVLLTTSCTHALEMAALLLDIGPGDEVVLPSFTFVSTANAFALRGARLVFVDVRPDTLNLDERLLAEAVSDRTKAIVVVHYAGVACAMDDVLAVAEPRGIAVIEDNAHGLGGTYRRRPLGSFGVLATQSFHETKNVQCGEGGALLVNDTAQLHRAEVLREKGTNRSQFFRGQVDKYTWVGTGSSYLPSDLLAAYLLAQLEEFATIQARRHALWDGYAAALTDWAAEHGVGLPHVPEECGHPAHLFYVLLPDRPSRTMFIEHLKARQVHSVFHYVPLHSSPEGRRLGGDSASCPVTESVSDRLARLPLYAGLADADHARVIEAVLSFRP